jgi:hypothetical protein
MQQPTLYLSAPHFRRVDAEFVEHIPVSMEDVAVTSELLPGGSHLLSSSCSSPASFGLDLLQTPPQGTALPHILAFGAANTQRERFRRASSVPSLGHTMN